MTKPPLRLNQTSNAIKVMTPSCKSPGRDTGPEAVQAYYELKTVNLTENMEPLFS